jgi:GDSL-like Lipase/Acylhydrolase family
MTSRLLATLGCLLSVSSVHADMIDDYHTAPGTVTPFAAPPLAGRRIMVIGDSIMSGTGLTKSADQATFRLQKYSGVIIHNFASPGACMADVSVLPGMNHTAPTTIGLLNGFFGMYGLVVALGTNDWGQTLITPSSFSSAYGVFLDTEQQALPRLRIACMGMPWSTSEGLVNAHGKTRDDYRAIIKGVCEARGYVYLDGLQAIPHSPAYLTDGVHLNDKGNRSMGQFLIRALHGLGWTL